MRLINRMIQGAKNLFGGSDAEVSINVICIQLEQPAKRVGQSQPYRTREEAIAAAKAEIDVNMN